MYWFYLSPSVYISIKENVLLYDTDKNRYFIVYDSSLTYIFESLLDLKNMGAVTIDYYTAKNDTIEQLVKAEYGVLIEADKGDDKPAMLPIKCGINIDFDRTFNDNTLYDLVLCKDISKYLLDVYLILNVDNDSNASKYFISQSLALETFYHEILGESILNNILSQIEHFPISQIRLVVDNIYSFNKGGNLEKLLDNIHMLNKTILLILNIRDYSFKNVRDDVQYEFIIDSYTEGEYLKQIICRLNNEGCSYRFMIQNRHEYYSALELIQECELDNYSIIPFFNGHNKNFIVELFSVEENDILERSIPLKEIFRNTKINSNLFGTLIFTPNGEIYADTNAPAICKIKDGKILDCVLKEVVSKNSWRDTRNFPRCQRCLFQYLCPPSITL